MTHTEHLPPRRRRSWLHRGVTLALAIVPFMGAIGLRADVADADGPAASSSGDEPGEPRVDLNRTDHGIELAGCRAQQSRLTLHALPRGHPARLPLGLEREPLVVGEALQDAVRGIAGGNGAVEIQEGVEAHRAGLLNLRAVGDVVDLSFPMLDQFRGTPT